MAQFALTASQTLEAVYNSLAPLWVELSFLFFFSMGFFYLRAENFRKGKKFQKDGPLRMKSTLEPQFRASVPLTQVLDSTRVFLKNILLFCKMRYPCLTTYYKSKMIIFTIAVTGRHVFSPALLDNSMTR